MNIQTYNRHDLFAKTLTASTGNQIIKVWEANLNNLERMLIPQTEHVITNGFINSLRITSKITSIPEVDLPTLTVQQSRTERLNLTRDYEWKNARKQLNLYISTGTSGWVSVGAVSLMNQPPFRMFSLMEYFTSDVAIPLGGYGSIGLGLVNVGYGLLQGEDSIVISGQATTEVVVLPIENEPIKDTQNYGEVIGTTSKVFIPAIRHKKQVTLTNVGEADIFLSIGRPAEINKGICLRANGGSYEFNRANHPFDLEIQAISTGSSLLTGLVAV